MFVWGHLILSNLIILVAPCLFGSPLILSPRVLSCGRASRLSCCSLAPQGGQCWGNIPPDWYKTPHYRPWAVFVLCVCTSVLLVLWSSGQIKPSGEGGGGALEGLEKEVGGLWRARRGGIDTNGDWCEQTQLYPLLLLLSGTPPTSVQHLEREESDLHTKYSFGVWSRVC